MRIPSSFQHKKRLEVKAFILVIFLVTSILNNLFSQTPKDRKVYQDTLTWYIYVGGKPHIRRIKCEEKMARSWGVKTVYFYGDCGETYDFKVKEFEEKNKVVFEYLKMKYGENWEEKFYKEVEKEFESTK